MKFTVETGDLAFLSEADTEQDMQLLHALFSAVARSEARAEKAAVSTPVSTPVSTQATQPNTSETTMETTTVNEDAPVESIRDACEALKEMKLMLSVCSKRIDTMDTYLRMYR